VKAVSFVSTVILVAFAQLVETGGAVVVVVGVGVGETEESMFGAQATRAVPKGNSKVGEEEERERGRE